jgi:hypothetical protein
MDLQITAPIAVKIAIAILIVIGFRTDPKEKVVHAEQSSLHN